jgi:hypothetical protein
MKIFVNDGDLPPQASNERTTVLEELAIPALPCCSSLMISCASSADGLLFGEMGIWISKCPALRRLFIERPAEVTPEVDARSAYEITRKLIPMASSFVDESALPKTLASLHLVLDRWRPHYTQLWTSLPRKLTTISIIDLQTESFPDARIAAAHEEVTTFVRNLRLKPITGGGMPSHLPKCFPNLERLTVSMNLDSFANMRLRQPLNMLRNMDIEVLLTSPLWLRDERNIPRFLDAMADNIEHEMLPAVRAITLRLQPHRRLSYLDDHFERHRLRQVCQRLGVMVGVAASRAQPTFENFDK